MFRIAAWQLILAVFVFLAHAESVEARTICSGKPLVELVSGVKGCSLAFGVGSLTNTWRESTSSGGISSSRKAVFVEYGVEPPFQDKDRAWRTVSKQICNRHLADFGKLDDAAGFRVVIVEIKADPASGPKPPTKWKDGTVIHHRRFWRYRMNSNCRLVQPLKYGFGAIQW